MVAELRFARTCAVAYPRSAAKLTHSKASRVLPTPAGPASSTPPASPSMAATTRASSPARPTSGQVAVFTGGAAPAQESRCAVSHRRRRGGIPARAGRLELTMMMHQAMMGFRRDTDAVAGKHIDRALVRRVFGLAR